jgi:hypothetical protein
MPMAVGLTRLTIFNDDFEFYEGIKELIENLNHEKHIIIAITHDIVSKNIMEAKFKETFDFEVRCIFRYQFKEIINEENAGGFVIVGSSDHDLHLAAQKRMLIINPGWSVKKDEKPKKYGITLKHPSQLFEAIRLLDNQYRWYFQLDDIPNATVLALTSANTYNRDVYTSEKEILEGFSNLLKDGDRTYFNTLYFHMISGVMKNDLLRKVDIWGVFPTSTGELNPELEELKERCRYLTNRRMKEPLFIRHTGVPKSRATNAQTRLQVGCIKHFDSIHLNPHYDSKRIKGKVVCIIDDYTTNGISFETARNLLLKAGASRVILLALGRFRKGLHGVYQYEEYEIDGNIRKSNYDYNLKKRQNLVGMYDNGAREEIRKIYDILK